MHALHMHTHTHTPICKVCVCFSEVCLMKQALGRGAASENADVMQQNTQSNCRLHLRLHPKLVTVFTTPLLALGRPWVQ